MMDFLVDSEEKVKYECACGALKPIFNIYFCRHCMKIRCSYCVSHEVDLHYCPTCLENLPSTEARLKKNRCSNCFNCPGCQTILNVRAVSSSAPHPDDPTKMVSKKVYYLTCSFCRWTSREAGIPDQGTASGGWSERECPYSKRLCELVEHYQEMVILDEIEEEEKKKKKFYAPGKPYYDFNFQKYRLGASILHRRKVAAPKERHIQCLIQPAEPSATVPGLPEDIFTTSMDLASVTSMQQRLSSCDFQPKDVKDLYPVHKPMLAKRALRCRECEHNVSKPEFNPSAIKFKILLSAVYHVPEVRFLTCEPVYLGQESVLIITVCNPTQHAMSFSLLPYSEEYGATADSEETSQEESAEPKVVIKETWKRENSAINGTITLPDTKIQIVARDDAAEYDDSIKHVPHTASQRYIAWHKYNKVALKLKVKPFDEASGNLRVAFGFEYSYINTMTTLEKKEPQKLQLKCQVFINAGQIFVKGA